MPVLCRVLAEDVPTSICLEVLSATEEIVFWTSGSASRNVLVLLDHCVTVKYK